MATLRESNVFAQPEEEKTYGFTETLKASINQNIIGAKMLQEHNNGFNYTPDSDYSPATDRATEMFDMYNVPGSKRNDFEANSYLELEDKLKQRADNQREAEIAFHSPTAIALSVTTGFADPTSWMLGAGIGKVAKLGVGASKLTTTQARVIGAGVGATDALASTYLLEKSLGNDLTTEQLAINGALGFTIGYGLGKGMLRENIKEQTRRIVQDGVEIEVPTPKSSWFSNIFDSTSEKMMKSQNSIVAGIGSKIKRTTRNVGEQSEDTVEDLLAKMKGDYNIKTQKQFETDFIKEYEKITGRKWSSEDDDAFMEAMRKIDRQRETNLETHIANRKSETIDKQAEEFINNEINPRVEEARRKIDEIGQDETVSDVMNRRKKVTELEKDIQNRTKSLDSNKLEKSKLKQAKKDATALKNNIKKATSKLNKLKKERQLLDKNKATAKEKRAKTLEIKKANKQLDDLQTSYKTTNDEVTRLSSIDTASESKAITAIKKELIRQKSELRNLERVNKKQLDNQKKLIQQQERELAKLEKQLQKQLDDIKAGKMIDDDMIKTFKKEGIDINMKNIDEIIDNLGGEYAKGIKIVQNGMFRKFGERIKSSKLDMLEDIDTSFYIPAMYRIDKIAKDTNGAIDAFKRGILANYDQADITPELIDTVEEVANDIVTNLLGKNADGVSIQALSSKSIERLLKNTGKARLKGRKLKLDRTHLTDFMSNNIHMVMTNYSREMSANIALKEKFNIGTRRIEETLDDGTTRTIQHSQDSFAKENKLKGNDKQMFDDAMNDVRGLARFDPNSNSAFSKITRMFNSINYLNFGGWFGVNTLTDLGNIANDFGLARTLKYATSDVIGALNKSGDAGRKMARYMGFAGESLTNDKAIQLGMDGVEQAHMFKGEKTLLNLSARFSKITGLNTVVDFMERTSSMATLDYILTAKQGTKFIKNMNRLGLSVDDVNALRNSNFYKFDGIALSDANFDLLDKTLGAKLERALRRSVDDTVLKANDLDTPKWLSEIFGSKALAKALFQFLRFPIVSHNKLLVKMANNFDAADAIGAIAIQTFILGLTTQLKDFGKEEKKFDLGTEDGQLAVAKNVIERITFFGGASLVTQQYDLVGRMLNLTTDDKYYGYDKGLSMGVTFDRLNDVHDSLGNMMSGNFTKKDAMTAMSFISSNPYFLQPAVNILNDSVKEHFKKDNAL